MLPGLPFCLYLNRRFGCTVRTLSKEGIIVVFFLHGLYPLSDEYFLTLIIHFRYIILCRLKISYISFTLIHKILEYAILAKPLSTLTFLANCINEY